MTTWPSKKVLISVVIVAVIAAAVLFVPVRDFIATQKLLKTSQDSLPTIAPAEPEIVSPVKSLPININVPEGAGHVVNGYKPKSEDAKVIIHIQDIHTNYEAQKNLSRMLEAMVKENQLKLIMVEGGWGNVSLSYLREYADKERRLEVAEEYLKEGKISGEEYLDIVSDYDIELEGLEEEELYKANLDTFFEIEKFRQEGVKELARIDRAVESLKAKLYPAQLLELEKAAKDYDNEKITLAEYYRYMNTLAKKNKIDMSQYPNFKSFIQVTESEKEINFPTVEKERTVLIEKLSKKLSKQKLTDLVTKSLEFRLNKLTPSEYHSYLLETATSAGENVAGYPNLQKYVIYIQSHEDIDTAALFDEAGALSAAVEAKLIKDNTQQRLSRISNAVHVLDNFLNLKLVPNDFKYYKAHRNDFNTASWIDFLKKQARRNKASTTGLKPARTIDKNLSTLVKFYDLANERDDTFVQNAIKLMNDKDADLAVLIAGGFHTPSLKQKLRECGMAYVVIAPHTTQETDPEQYRYILKYKSGREE